ncbi:hypothetical protein ACHAW5_003296 [Stephanodiscus triporus]|uniref:Uncharacterized protein n=1 Tax=Stephanodiscus triporus TaxID=2934178 RepID=A0ABD3NV43_9STRA
MMASIVALDRDGDSTDDADSCDDGDARRAADYGAVVIFGLGPRSDFGTSSRCAMVDSAIIEESYNRCRLNILDRKKLAE